MFTAINVYCDEKLKFKNREKKKNRNTEGRKNDRYACKLNVHLIRQRDCCWDYVNLR